MNDIQNNLKVKMSMCVDDLNIMGKNKQKYDVMENPNEEHSSGRAGLKNACPPSPPPLPPPPFPKIMTCKTLEKCKRSKTNKCYQPNLDEQVSVLNYVHCFANLRIISYCKFIHSIIQEGPSCGIVALSMASQFFKEASVTFLLDAAKVLKFSKSGEIFSAYNMATLASSFLNCDAIVIDDLIIKRDIILSHICSGWPVLIPYDADKNHEPCLNNGRSAHWAVLSGLSFALPENCILPSDTVFETTPTGLKVHIAKHALCFNELISKISEIYVYARQGKSRHLALWNLEMLLQSNNNLFEVTNKYGMEELVLSENGISELRDKAVLLKPLNSI